MAVSAKMVLAASRSFTERSRLSILQRQARRPEFCRFLLVCRGLAQTQRRKGSLKRGGEIRQMLPKNWNAKSDLQARKSSWQKAGQVADF